MLLAVVAAAAHMSGVSTAAPPPVATKISQVLVSGITPPSGGPNNPAALVEAGTAFTVGVHFTDALGTSLPLSYTRDSVVTLSVVDPKAGTEPPSDAGSADFVAGRVIDVPAGASAATATAFILDEPDNRIRIRADVTGGSRDAKAASDGFSAVFDVVFDVTTQADSNKKYVSTSGSDAACVPTTDKPTCADVFLHSGTRSGSLVSLGQCDVYLGCPAKADVVQFLADLDPALYTRTQPATLVLKCDKSVCKGGGVSSYLPLIELKATGPLTSAAACASKGVLTAGEAADPGYCVDRVQSKRDGAGDLHLYVLFVRDVRGSCC